MKPNKCTAVLVLSLFLIQTPLFAQHSEDALSSDESDAITFYNNSGEKHYVAALAGMFSSLFVIGGWNRFVVQASWAKVTLDDMAHFYEKNLSWDDDWYWTNFVLHPYQGALPYMGARSANLSVLESGLISVASSTIWEWFCERNAPSKNDMVYSTVASVAVGEMLYRLSFEAAEINSLLGIAFNPVQLVTRPIAGEKPAGSSGHIKELFVKTAVGTSYAYASLPSTISSESATEQFPVYFAPEIFVAYDDVYRLDSNRIYDQFNLSFAAAIGPGSGKGVYQIEKDMMYDIRITTDGSLLSRVISETDSVESSAGLCFDYDFRWHSYMLLSSLAPGFMFNQRLIFDESTFSWRARLEWEALGTTDFFYFRRGYLDMGEGTSRHYSYTTGAAAVLEAKYRTEKGSALSAVFHGYAMYDFGNQLKYNADTGWEFIGILDLNAEKAITPLVHLGLTGQLVAKKTLYRHYDDLYQLFGSAGAYAKFQLK